MSNATSGFDKQMKKMWLAWVAFITIPIAIVIIALIVTEHPKVYKCFEGKLYEELPNGDLMLQKVSPDTRAISCGYVLKNP